jgi:nucleotide-binding universal stress UspA family protein
VTRLGVVMRKTVVLAVDGRQPAPEIVATLREAGVTAEAEIRETHVGHVARAILDAADEHDARFLVLGSSGPRPSRPCRRPSRANPAQASPPRRVMRCHLPWREAGRQKPE